MKMRASYVTILIIVYKFDLELRFRAYLACLSRKGGMRVRTVERTQRSEHSAPRPTQRKRSTQHGEALRADGEREASVLEDLA
jgi:hypothetical protein